MNKPEFGNYNKILWEKLFNDVECEQIKKYYFDWTSLYIPNKKYIYIETLINDIIANSVAVKQDGTICISLDNCIRTYNKNGILLEQFDGINDLLPFKSPRGIAIGKNDEIIVADSDNNRICSIINGKVKVIAGDINGEEGDTDGNGLLAKFNFPIGVAIHSDGTIFVADMFNKRISTISTNGDVTTIKKIKIRAIAMLNDNTIIFISYDDNICSMDINKKNVSTIAGSIYGNVDGNGLNSQFKMPSNIAITKDQTIIISDHLNHSIRSINANYDVKTIAGGIEGDQDGFVAIAKIGKPSGLAIAPDNSIIIVDAHNKKIRRLYYK
jgi:hypothetical protein